MPAAVQPLERILDHVLSGSQVPDHDQRQTHKLKMVGAKQVRHGHHGIAAVRSRKPRPVTPPASSGSPGNMTFTLERRLTPR
jgi:hypothetical protein